MRAGPAILLLLCGGCRSGLLDGDAAVAAGDGGALRDFAGGGCSSHQLEDVQLDGIGIVDGPPRVGAAVRMVLYYRRLPCDVPGAVTVKIEPGDATDFVSVTAHLWVSDDGNCGTPVMEHRVVVLSDLVQLGNPQLTVADTVGSATATTPVLPMTGGDCGRPVMLGSSCQLDCECQAAFQPARCMPVGATDGKCAVSCTEDVDCPDDIPRCGVGASAPSSCGGGGPCQRDAECPFGQRCTEVPQTERACRAAQMLPVGACGCDGDCPFGSVCDRPLGVASGHCVAPCSVDADCARTTSPRGQGQCDPGISACNTEG